MYDIITNRAHSSPLSAMDKSYFTLSGPKRRHLKAMDTGVRRVLRRLPVLQQACVCQPENFYCERATAVEHVVATGVFAPAPSREIASGAG